MYKGRPEVLTKSLSADERHPIGKFIRQIKKLYVATVKLVHCILYGNEKCARSNYCLAF